jgi:hypothetical protein
VLAEGWRFLEAKQCFMAEFEEKVRASITLWAQEQAVALPVAQATFSHFMLAKLWSTPRPT